MSFNLPSTLTRAIRCGADVEELISTTKNPRPHLYNHPLSLEIEHWITIFAYADSGSNTDYVDPAHSSAIKWSPPPPAYG